MSKKLFSYIKTGIDAIKAAKFLWTIIGLLGLYAGYNEVDKVASVPQLATAVVEKTAAPTTVIESVVQPVAPQKGTNWLSLVKEEITKSEESHCIEHHGCR